MALKGARFDLDAARRAYDREREPLGFRFMAHDYIVMREPSLGWAPITRTVLLCAFKNREVPVIVPVVPIALTK